MTQPTHFQIVSPADGSVYAERPYHQLMDATTVADHARHAQRDWAKRSISERARYCSAFVDAFLGLVVAASFHHALDPEIFALRHSTVVIVIYNFQRS